MLPTNVQVVEAPRPCYRNNYQFCGCTTRRCALISSWVLVIVNGFLFINVIWNTANTIMNFDQTKYRKNVAVIWDFTTGETKKNDGTSDSGLSIEYFGRRLLNHLKFGLGFGFSILLLIGVYRKNTNFLLAWIIYFLVSCGIIFIYIIYEGESYQHFEKVLTVKLIVLSFTIFFLILRYYKELRETESSQTKNLSEFQVTVADPLQAHLQPHLQAPYQPYPPPYSQSPWFPQNYAPNNNYCNPVRN